MSRPLIVGLRGVAGAGKTRLAGYMSAHHRHITKLSFAAPLKNGLATMGLGKEQEPVLYRLAAQWIGTDLVRTHNPDHWVNLFKKRVEEIAADFHTHYTRIVIVDDVRFQNEIDVCDFTAFIQPSFTRSAMPEGTESHASEALALAGPQPDELVLLNDGHILTLEVMSARLLAWINPPAQG